MKILYRLVNTVTPSSNTTMRQMLEMSQWNKTGIK